VSNREGKKVTVYLYLEIHRKESWCHDGLPDGRYLMRVEVSNVLIRGRIRTETGELDGLCDSIKKYGLLNPIIVRRAPVKDVHFGGVLPGFHTWELVSGHRRLLAHKRLGLEEVEAKEKEGLSEYEAKEIELEENIRRKQLTFVEELRATKLLHEMKQKEHGVPTAAIGGTSVPGWTQEMTGELLGVKKFNISRDLQLATAIEEHPELAECESKNEAWRRLQRMQDLGLREVIGRVLSAEAKERGDTGVRFAHDDAIEFIKTVPSGSVNLIVTDPPFGVDLEKAWDWKKYWAGAPYKGFDDSLKAYIALISTFLPEAYRVLVEGSHFYMFFASKNWNVVKMLFENHWKGGFDDVPLIWNKKFGGTNYDALARYTPNYEPCCFAWKGHRKLNRPGWSVLEFAAKAPQSKLHPTDKPNSLWEYLITQSSVKEELVGDFFAGSAGALVAARRLGRRVIGCEIDERWFGTGVLRLREEEPSDQPLRIQ